MVTLRVREPGLVEERSLLFRYGAAVACVLAAMLLRLPLQPVLGLTAPFLFFYPATFVAAFVGGLGPGLVATVLGAIVAYAWVIAPSFEFGPPDAQRQIGLAVFVASGAFISYICERYHDARRRAARHAARNAEILDSITERYYVLDVEHRFVEVNALAEEYFGIPRDRLLGRSIWDALPAISGSAFEEHYRRASRERIPIHAEVPSTLKPGEWAEVHIYPTREGLAVSFRDITARKTVEDALSRSEAVYRRILESGMVGVLFWSIDGGVTDANDTLLELIGRSRDELEAGRIDWRRLTPPEWVEADVRAAEQLQAHGYAPLYEKELVAADGRRVSVLLSAAVLDEARTSGIAFVLDLTELKRAQRERDELLVREQAARQRAEEASRLKDEFLATISHELRTPLNAMLGWARMLSSGKLGDDERARAVSVIERNTVSQAQLIEDLLDISRIISGKLRLDVRDVDMSSVVEAAIDSLRLAADAKGVRLHKVLDPNAGPIAGDPERLQQVVWNLLSNAIKFTPKQGRVHVRLARVDSQVELTVSDTGCGIAPEFLPYVFDRFRQAEASTVRAFGGLGLGLAIVRQLVELHGGTVSAHSDGEGAGAAFRVELPLSVLAGPMAGERVHPTVSDAPPLAAAPSLAGLRVMLVDDEPDTRDMLSVALAHGQADVLACATGSEALERLVAWRPDVLVSDIGMPGMDGYDLIRRVRQLPAEDGGNVLAVALTAYARVEDRVRSLAAGYHMHVAKPVEPVELLATIASLANLKN